MTQVITSGASQGKAHAKKAKEPRFPKKIRVTVQGIDSNGNAFKQSVQTVNISRSGARLDGPCCLRGPGTVILVKRHWKKAKFRVVWVGPFGSPESCQIGICLAEPGKKVW
ncbi:MAG TPA: PilZ domain-containing protein [Candidatus Acidoferrales bacterium]|nr:PilZ domain-containing protein [Candidatus Acidoferrales bacterium]